MRRILAKGDFFLCPIQAALVLLVAFVSLNLYSYDFSVPFFYSGDSVVILMYIKGLTQDGWPTVISHLSAPFGYSGAAFPMLTSVDWLIIKALSIFSKEPGYLLNEFWLLSLVLSAFTATYASSQLGLTRLFAYLGGGVYAFLPFALLRNVAHLNLVYYLVPLLCLLAVTIATCGGGVRNTKQASIVGLFACALQGFNYIYYSFFAVLLFGVATLIMYKRSAGLMQIRLPLSAIVIVSLSVAINMIPTIQSWHQNGHPPEMGYKSLAEAEVYGAKIRTMLSPHPDNAVRPLGGIGKKILDANFPNENENTTARLGLYGALGLILMIIFVLRGGVISGAPQPMTAISALSLATLLIITVGGFGTIINVITVPDIRAYNRFSVFLSFFAISFAGLWIQGVTDTLSGIKKNIGCLIFLIFVALSLYDQLLDSKWLVATQKSDIYRANEERMVVRQLETYYKGEASVLQLPFTGFPPLATFNKMESYDHVRPYLWSHHLNWSWPSFSQRHRTWQTKLSTLRGKDLIDAAVFSGFDAIWVDRFAYADSGKELLTDLKQYNLRSIDIGSSRFEVLDLKRAAAELKASMSDADFKRHSNELLGGEILVEWGAGFYPEEYNSERRAFRWAQDVAKIELRNSGSEFAHVCVDFDIASSVDGYVQLGGAIPLMNVNTSTVPQPVRIQLSIKPGEASKLRFFSQVQRLNVPHDSRNLHFYVINFKVRSGGESKICDETL